MAPLRFVALRAARAEVRAAAQPGAARDRRGDDHGARGGDRRARVSRRAARGGRAGAPLVRRARRRSAGARSREDRSRGRVGRRAAPRVRRGSRWPAATPAAQTAWRALVAQVAAGADEPAARARARSRGSPRRSRAGSRRSTELAAATGIASAQLGAGADHLAALREQVDAAAPARSARSATWTQFHLARRAAIVAGVGPAIAAIERGDLAAAELAAAWERATLLAWADAELARTPALARFDGAAHHAHVAAFADLDRGCARARAHAARSRGSPSACRALRQPDADPEPSALLAARRARSSTAGRAAARACSPSCRRCCRGSRRACSRRRTRSRSTSIRRCRAFDVVVFDEASRLPIAHALGALARAPRGDRRRRFAPARARPTAPRACSTTALAARLPELALARALPQPPRGPVRVREPALLRRSPRRLLPARAAARRARHRVARSTASPIARGANRAEAEAIVAELPRGCAIRRSARARSRSSRCRARSRTLIEDLLDAARAADPALDAALERRRRRAAARRHARARCRARSATSCCVVGRRRRRCARRARAARWRALARRRDHARARAADRVLELRARGRRGRRARAARDLAELLAFARAGGGAGARPTTRRRRARSPRRSRARSPSAAGSCATRSAAAPYKIDLAVVDPNDPERYVLAIEHDGAAYASAPVARDRDRLRAQVLVAARLAPAPDLVARLVGRSRARDPARARRDRRGDRGESPATRAPRRAAVRRGSRASGSAPVLGAVGLVADRRRPARDAARACSPALAARLADRPASTRSGDGRADPAPARRDRDRSVHRRRDAGGPARARRHVRAAPRRRARQDRRAGARRRGADPRRPARAPGRRVLRHRPADASASPIRSRGALDGRGRFGDEQGVVWRLDQDPASVPPRARRGHERRRRAATIDEVPLSEVAAAARIVVERAARLSAPPISSATARGCSASRGSPSGSPSASPWASGSPPSAP